MKFYVLICAHLIGEKIPNVLYNDYCEVIRILPQMIQSLIAFLMGVPPFVRRLQQEYYQRGYKFMGAGTILTLIRFQQYVFQGLWLSDEPIFQLEFFNSDLRRLKRVPQLRELVQRDAAERKLEFLKDESAKAQLNK